MAGKAAPQPSGGGGGGGGGDNAFSAIWISLLLMIAGWLIWKFAHAQIVAILFKLKLYQINAISYFWPESANIIPYLKTVNPASVTFEQFSNTLAKVGGYVSYPYVVILVVLAAFCYLTNKSLRFRKTHSMQTLRAQEQSNWPQITPVIKLDLVNQDIAEGPWAMAMSPLEFCKKHKLLKRDEASMIGLRPVPMATIKRDEARRVFLLQLGRYWEGPEALPPYMQALLAVFTAKINRDRDGYSRLLLQISHSAALDRLNFSGSRPLLHKYFNTQKVQEVVQRHAYVYTVMAHLISVAREDGVLPTAEFLWLKPLDRRLWYILNTVGRQTPFPEVSGPYAHFLAEKGFGRKILVPMVEEAVKGLEVAVKEIKLTPAELEAL